MENYESILHKRIETFVAGSVVLNDGNPMPVEDVKVGHTWVTLTVRWFTGTKKIRAPKGTLLPAPLSQEGLTEEIVDAAAQAAFVALSKTKSEFAPEEGLRWEDLKEAYRADYHRLAYDLLIGKYRPARSAEERRALNLVEDVAVATARTRGWKGR